MSNHFNEHTAISALAALAHDHRLAIFRLLVKTGEGGLAAGQIAEALDCPASSLSFHLSHMTQSGVITQQRVGRSLIYRVSFEHFLALMRFLLEDCCQGNEEVCAPLADMLNVVACCDGGNTAQ